MKRTVFGQEQWIETDKATCPVCKVERGQLHDPGCPVEQCSECGGQLVKCSCMELSAEDGLKAIQNISQILNQDDVTELIQNTIFLGRSYLEKAADLWLMRNGSAEMKKAHGGPVGISAYMI